MQTRSRGELASSIAPRPGRRPFAAGLSLFLLLQMVILVPGPAEANHLTGTPATYTLDADFDEGAYVNVGHPVADQLELLPPLSLPVIWIAVSGEGTIVKINTQTGVVLGKYWSAPDGMGRDPSRTTVDHRGGVWAGNRGEYGDVNGAAKGSVIHIGLVENGDCVDRNGNSVIDTSTGLNDVRPWLNTGGIDSFGGVATAEDECILHYVRVTSTGARHISVDLNNDVWVSGTGNWPRAFDLVDGATGAILQTCNGFNCGGYGGLISNGVIWSATSGDLLRWDTTQPVSTHTCSWPTNNGYSYGVCRDSLGNVWTTGGTDVHKWDPAGANLASYPNGASGFTQGCAIDGNDHVWIAHSFNEASVGRVDPSGTWLGNVPVSSGPTGVSVDAAGKVWSTDYSSGQASRIDPNGGGPGAVDYTSPFLGGVLYDYSDMTGSLHRGPRGSWTVVHDGGTVCGSDWTRVSWTASEPGNSTITVTAASSPDGITFSSPAAVANGGAPAVPDARYLRAVVSFQRASTGATPILYDLTLEGQAVEPCENPAGIDADCEAWGILVQERDATGIVGDLTVSRSHSRVAVQSVPGSWPAGAPPPPPPAPPADPHAHADADEAGFAYSNGFLALDVRSLTVFSQCDAFAVDDGSKGLYAEAYGRGGIEDLAIALGGTPVVEAKVLDWEGRLVGTPAATTLATECEIVELGLFPPPPLLSYCPAPNTILIAGVGPVTVTVTLNEHIAPFLNAGGEWIAGGAAAHVEVAAPTGTVDVWLGLVLLSARGGPIGEPPECVVLDARPSPEGLQVLLNGLVQRPGGEIGIAAPCDDPCEGIGIPGAAVVPGVPVVVNPGAGGATPRGPPCRVDCAALADLLGNLVRLSCEDPVPCDVRSQASSDGGAAAVDVACAEPFPCKASVAGQNLSVDCVLPDPCQVLLALGINPQACGGEPPVADPCADLAQPLYQVCQTLLALLGAEPGG